MSKIQIGVVRYASVATELAKALPMVPVPEFRIAQWRITLTFRGLGASRWPELQQVEHAKRVVAVARHVFAQDKRRAVRSRANRAIVVIYEDATVVQGCAVTARWECVVPA